MNQNSRRYDVLREIRNDPRASFRELMERTGLKTTSSVSYHIDRLIEEGLISKERYLSRSLEIVGNPTPSLPSPKLGRAPNLGEEKIDQRKRNSAKTCEKKQKAGQQGRGTSATINKQRTERKLKEWERIEMVVQAAANKEIGNGKDVVKDHRGYTSLHCTKVG